jgi:hypothetical protein
LPVGSCSVYSTEILVNTAAFRVSKVKSYPCNRPWRPIGLWDVKDPTLSRQSAHS